MTTIWLRAKDAEVLSYLQGFGRGDVFVKKEWIKADLRMSDESVRQSLHHLRTIGCISGYFEHYKILKTCEDKDVRIPTTIRPKNLSTGVFYV